MDRDALLKCHFTLSAKRPSSRAYPVSLVTLGDHIRKRRLDMKLLQKDVAEMLDVDTMTVNNWERNRCQPRLYLFPRIVQFIGYNPSPTEPKPTIGEEIKAYRFMHGLSLKKLAKMLGVDPTTLTRWEKGASNPGSRLRKRVAGLLGSSTSGISQEP